MVNYCGSCGARLPETPGGFCRECGAATTGEPARPSRQARRWPLFAVGTLLAALAVGTILLFANQTDSADRTPSASLTDPDGGPSGSLPHPGDLSPDVATVTHVPASIGVVSKADFDHALEQEAAQAGLKAPPKPGGAKYEELKETVLYNLLQSIWAEGAAAEMGIAVSDREVVAELQKIKRENFETDTQYRTFLQKSKYTPADVDKRVKLQILSTGIQERVEGQVSAPTKIARQRERQERMASFVSDFNDRWRSRTVCAPGFVIESCSNGEAKHPEASAADAQPGDSGTSDPLPGGVQGE